MKFTVINDHVCMVKAVYKLVDRKWVWVIATKTLCGTELAKDATLVDELPPQYLCSGCDSVSSKRRAPHGSLVRQLPKLSLPRVPQYEHLEGRAGIHLIHKAPRDAG